MGRAFINHLLICIKAHPNTERYFSERGAVLTLVGALAPLAAGSIELMSKLCSLTSAQMSSEGTKKSGFAVLGTRTVRSSSAANMLGEGSKSTSFRRVRKKYAHRSIQDSSS